MLSDTIERVNRLRQQALADPKFLKSAKAHEKALQDQDTHYIAKRRKAKSNKERSLADIYQQAEFGQRPDSAQH